MSVFGNLTNDGLEETNDRLGGFNVRDTDASDATIKVAYAGQSAGGARNVTLVVNLLQSGGIAGVGQVASFYTHGGYVGGAARMPRHIDLLGDHKSALLKLIQILGEEMLDKNGG